KAHIMLNSINCRDRNPLIIHSPRLPANHAPSRNAIGRAYPTRLAHAEGSRDGHPWPSIHSGGQPTVHLFQESVFLRGRLSKVLCNVEEHWPDALLPNERATTVPTGLQSPSKTHRIPVHER